MWLGGVCGSIAQRFRRRGDFDAFLVIDAFGKSSRVLLVVAAVGAVFLFLTGKPAGSGALVVWTFDRASADSFPAEVDGRSVEVRRVPVRLLDVRVMALSMAAAGREKGSGGGGVGIQGGTVDLVETEMGSVGKYFLSPSVAEGAWVGLGERLAAAPWARSLPESRLAVWRDTTGVQRLLPRDIHPTTLTYQPELFAEVGLDATVARTWGELAELCGAYERARAELGQASHRAIEWPRANASVVLLILQQRGVELISAGGRPDLSDPRIAETLAAYAGWVGRAGVPPARSVELTAGDLIAGRLAMLPTADWRAGLIERAAPELSGKLRMRPLPVFSLTENNAPTATWGGTGIGIPASARDPEASWRLLELLYTDNSAAVDRYLATRVLPVLPETWGDPRLTASEPFYGGQAVGRLLAALAGALPPAAARRVSPLYPTVQMELNGVTSAVVSGHAEGDPGATRAFAERLLAAAQVRLDARWAALGGAPR